MFRFQMVLAAALVLCGCQQDTAPPRAAAAQADRVMVVKPGMSRQEYSTDRYECMQASQRQTTRVANGVSDTSQTTNVPLYSACMSARGYSARKVSDFESQMGGPEVQAAIKAHRSKGASTICANPAYAAYFAKTPCNTVAITSQQMADTSKISPEAKAVLTEVRGALNAYADEYFRILRNGTPAGAKVADINLSVARPQDDKNDRDLYDGIITWGTYNKRRLEIYRDYATAAAAVVP